ncbi:efflux RND transporter periplasmic adaptor subunit [Henriciella sp. AS95]|uniref:efflux RND transporter periplasmic adaptor subunit n=1 Tax=Henriciella sp. AS95 TaxID=3135782 RepID=UPI003178EFDA
MRKSFSTILFAGVLLASLSACGDNSASGDAGAQQRPRGDRAVQIVPYKVTFETQVTRVEAVGTARARSSATIYPETAGEVIEVNFEAGDRVEKGQVLLRLESRQERLAVSQAEVDLADAKRLQARYSGLSSPGAIAQNELDRADVAYKAAAIELDVARDALADRTIRAPFSGYVGLTDIDPGARVTTATTITRIDDREVLYVDFPAPEATFSQIKAGDTITVQPFSNPEASYEAEILTTDSAIDTTTRAFTVRATIDNSDDLLRPGMSFRISFEIPGESLPSVPEASIVWGGDGAYLWAVEDGRVERVPVTIVSRTEGKVLVRSDIKEGDWIVEEGVHKVRQGAPVQMPDQTQNVARSADQADRAIGGARP